ncbi:LysR family transcriptional regulator [uncultured Jannaschia sp.]|uniref:LysR family transcriptional regulator n=1 Tax=uncultured Jannaschia sp. TaxID=293347 RepID=UPI002616487E|nr:LysR family transcriptional regulator [uncultured Jannaschia sp.]
MATLNYHHLRYFHAVARAGNLTRAAETLNVSQSALSTQIRTLEARLGHPLFDRVGRGLELTEVGRMALDHAERIFRIGDDLLATLGRAGGGSEPLRVGAVATLSRNFQTRFLAPVLGRETGIELRSDNASALIADLRTLALDVVLTSEPPRDAGRDLLIHPLATEPVAIHGPPDRLGQGTLSALLAEGAFILPSDPGIRSGFLALGERMGVTPRIAAEVDDMAMIRLLVREGAGLAVVPAVVVADELASGRLATAPFALDLAARFHAVTLRRRFPHPALAELLPA